jgi:hypothetical protein
MHTPMLVILCQSCLPQYGKVFRGLWHGTEVAIKTIILAAGMTGAQKREKMVSSTKIWQ